MCRCLVLRTRDNAGNSSYSDLQTLLWDRVRIRRALDHRAERRLQVSMTACTTYKEGFTWHNHYKQFPACSSTLQQIARLLCRAANWQVGRQAIVQRYCCCVTPPPPPCPPSRQLWQNRAWGSQVGLVKTLAWWKHAGTTLRWREGLESWFYTVWFAVGCLVLCLLNCVVLLCFHA